MAGRVLVAYGSKFDREPASDVRSLDAYLAMARKTAPELRDRGERARSTPGPAGSPRR